MHKLEKKSLKILNAIIQNTANLKKAIVWQR